MIQAKNIAHSQIKYSQNWTSSLAESVSFHTYNLFLDTHELSAPSTETHRYDSFMIESETSAEISAGVTHSPEISAGVTHSHTGGKRNNSLFILWWWSYLNHSIVSAFPFCNCIFIHYWSLFRLDRILIARLCLKIHIAVHSSGTYIKHILI